MSQTLDPSTSPTPPAGTAVVDGAPTPLPPAPGAGTTTTAPPAPAVQHGLRPPPPTAPAATAPPPFPPPPPVAMSWGWSPPVDAAPWRLALWALIGGIAFDVGVRGGMDNAVVALGVLVLVVALVTDQRLQRAEARWLAVGALVPALFLAIWSSPWLVATNFYAVAVLLGVAIVHARSGSILDTSPLRLLLRGTTVVGRAAVGPLVLRKAVPGVSKGTADKILRVGLALLVSVPLLAVVVALLASADAVFASFVAPDLELGSAVNHVVLAGFFALCIVCTTAATLGDSKVAVPPGKFGVLEVVTILGLTAAVLGLFVVSQLVALTDAGQRLVEEAGLLPAEYARSGFFQLCWAAVLLLILLALVRMLAAPGVWNDIRVRVLAGVVPVLAGGLVVVSLRRMQLYDEAFGLTMLRLWVVGAAVWMGSVLVMIALRNLGVGGSRNWVLGGAVASSLVLILLANVTNPEAFVLRHNVARSDDPGVELDASYLADLSDDAVPAMVDALDDVRSPSAREELRDELRCMDDAVGADALNLSARRSAAAREDAGIRPVPDAEYDNVCGYRYDYGD